MKWLILLNLLALSCRTGSADHDDAGLPGNPGDGGDSTGEADADGAATSRACPRNSRWPCTCSRVNRTCDDGNLCIHEEGATAGLGICSAECIPNQPDALRCPERDPFIAPAYCVLGVPGDLEATHCVLACSHRGFCPNDQDCVIQSTQTGLGHCMP